MSQTSYTVEIRVSHTVRTGDVMVTTDLFLIRDVQNRLADAFSNCVNELKSSAEGVVDALGRKVHEV